MPRALTSAELLVLGLLAERPRHGYDLDRVIIERGMREWTPIAFSSVYYLLRKLESDGYIAPVAAGGPRRRTYALTRSGRRLAVRATRDALSTVVPVHAPVLVGVANIALLDRAAGIAALQARCLTLAAEIERLATHREQRAVRGPVVGALFDFALTSLEAELRWARDTIARFEEGHEQG